MKIREIIAGVGREQARAMRVEPCAEGVTIVIVAPELQVTEGELARALVETLASPERETAREKLPFIRITADTESVELAIADDATGPGRMLTETRRGGVPLLLETEGDPDQRDARIERLLARVALAAGTEDASTLQAALSTADAPSSKSELSAHEPAYAAAAASAAALAREVRAIDDRMTASVVPDWIWIATGLGGAGVFMTVIALLYPELRVAIIPALVALSLLGFTAYALRAWRELKTRAALLTERAELRARREHARAETKRLARELEALGTNPAAILLRATTRAIPRSLPAIITIAGASDLASLDAGARSAHRQIIVLATTIPGEATTNPEQIRRFEAL